MQSALDLLRMVHVGAACSSLIVMGLPLALPKGSRWHRRLGWGWIGLMAVSLSTGLGLSLGYVAAPATFVPDKAADAVRATGLFLTLLGTMTASAIWQGVRAIARRRAPNASRHPVDFALPCLVLALALVVGIIGIGRASVPLSFFGATALFLATQHLAFALRPLPSRMAWWYGHMNGMLAAVIASLTAFSVSGLKHFLKLPPNLGVLPWIAPSLVLAPIVATWIRYYRRRFEAA